MAKSRLSGSIHSPFRYAGGKYYARKLILEHIPKHDSYIEPFAGGGSIFFAKPKVQKNQLNDIDSNLVNVYLAIRDDSEELISFLTVSENCPVPDSLLDKTPVGAPIPAKKSIHSFFKKNYKAESKLEEAGRWYYLNRTSYSGIMNFKNMYWGYGDKYSMQPKNWPANIRRTSKKLQGVQITSLDFEKVIDNAPDGALLFIDPPYYNADQDKFYTHYFNKEDHLRLENCIRRNSTRVHVFITYDNSEEVRDLYSWIKEMHDKEWNYCIQRTDDQKNGSTKKGSRYKGKELFLLNYSSKKLEESVPEQIKIQF